MKKRILVLAHIFSDGCWLGVYLAVFGVLLDLLHHGGHLGAHVGATERNCWPRAYSSTVRSTEREGLGFRVWGWGGSVSVCGCRGKEASSVGVGARTRACFGLRLRACIHAYRLILERYSCNLSHQNCHARTHQIPALYFWSLLSPHAHAGRWQSGLLHDSLFIIFFFIFFSRRALAYYEVGCSMILYLLFFFFIFFHAGRWLATHWAAS